MGTPETLPPNDPPQTPTPTSVDEVVTAHQSSPDFWARVKRHKVVEWTLAYVAFGYALLHGVQMLRETFDWPFLISRLTVFGLVLGAPIAATLAWYHGHRARHRVSGQELSILIALLVVAGSVLWWISRNSHERPQASATASVANTAESPTPTRASFTPPPHSIAVLPFVNMSGDKEQEYFSEGLTEELLNSLSRINELQVAARTSSFSFQGEHPDIAMVALKLNVGAVLEGSVRRSAHTVRITAQLVNGVTGFHLWSQTYDRELRDVLKLQTDVATAVARALQVTLLGDVAKKSELGGTGNPAAFDAYLRGLKAYSTAHGAKNYEGVIAAYTEAIRLDPSYALAFAARAIARDSLAFAGMGPNYRNELKKVEPDARRAIELAPDLGEAHLALARFFEYYSLDLVRATEEYDRAAALAAGNAMALRRSGLYAVYMGRTARGIAAARRAIVLDPLNGDNYSTLGAALYYGRKYGEAIDALQDALAVDPDDASVYPTRGLSYYALGNFESARASCEAKSDTVEYEYFTQPCLAVVYAKLGRHADAEAILAKETAAQGDADAYQYAEVYSQWGNSARALEWLETALRLRDAGLVFLRTDPLLDPLRNEPRFQAIERALKFPN